MNEERAVLALETSEIVCGVCVYFSADKFYTSSVSLKHSHAEKIFEIIDWVLKAASIKPGGLDAIAVSAGPGSFTGLRIGMSAAKGIAYGAGLPVIPVPTYEAFALQLSCLLEEGTEFIIANKVNKEEVYFAKFKIKSNSYIFAEGLTVLKNEEFTAKSDMVPVFGNAAVLAGKPVRFPMTPDSVYIAKWAVESGKQLKTFDYDFLEPIYLKNFIIKEKIT